MVRSIKHKIIIAMIFTGLIGALVVGIYNIYDSVRTNEETVKQYRAILYEQFDRNVKLQVETAVSLVQAVYEQQRKGLLTEAEARKRAADIVRELRFDNGNYFWIDTTEGVNVVLLGRDQEGKSRIGAKDAKGTAFIREFIANSAKPEGGYTDYWFAKPNQTQELPKRAYTLLFKPYNWIIGTGNWTDDIDAFVNKKAQEQAAQLRSKIMVGIMFLLLALVLSGLLAFYLGSSLAKPFLAMTNRIKTMADGDYSRDIDPAFMRRSDEFGEMAKAFDTLNNNMRHVIRNIMQATEQVSASSEELTASADQSAQAANQIAASITSVAGAATEQVAAANESASVVEQMSVGLQQVAANANQVAAQSAQAADKAKTGGQSVDKAVSQMGQIENTVNTSAAVVAKLGERSKEIGQIVDTIAGIAGQTNLLALNAAIEAARAGEQGRGFAVVAEEVRKLAEQSQEAAKKIADLIGEIRGDTDKAVVAMNDGTREVKTGAEVVNAAGVAFREIVALVSEVSGQVKEISAAVQQMAGGSQQIVGSVRKIDMLSKSSAAEEQLASMEEIASSSQALAKLAEDLHVTVNRFRV